MEKTPFAGLTVLESNESIYTDNAAFISRDRFEIDRDIRLGVKTHRHDGSDGLDRPVVAPSGLVVGSGGHIGAGLNLSLGVTFEDAYGGETQIGPANLVTTPSPLQSPTNALSGVASYVSGTLDVDSFTYAITYSDGEGGETPVGPAVLVTRDPGFTNASIKLEGLSTGMEEAGAAAWRLYRARSGGEYVFLKEGTGATFTDDGSTVAQCDVHPPNFNTNTTGGTNALVVTLPKPGAVDGLEFINLYCSQSGTFAEGCLVGQYPVGSGGGTVIVTSLELLDHQPPDVNRSYGGATKIDPDTELIDWHWKRPVATKADLPSEAEGSEEGDVRIALDKEGGWIFKGGKWEPWSGGSGGGSIAVMAEGGHPGTGGGGTFAVEDVFAGGEVEDPPWIVSGGTEDPNTYFNVEGGHLKNASGCPMYRDDVAGTDYVAIIKMNKEESAYFQCGVILESLSNRPSRLNAGIFGNELKIHLEINEGSSPNLATASQSLANNTDYWLKFTKTGNAIFIGLYETDPEGETVTLVNNLEVELDPEDAEQALFTVTTKPGLMYVGAPGGYVDYFKVSGEAGASEGEDYAEEVEIIEFGDDSAVHPTVTGSGNTARVDLSVPKGMGFVFCGGDLTKPRPTGFGCVTWMTEGKGEEEPEHMAEHDILVALP